MNIYHFENDIGSAILARGHRYYLEGNILEAASYGDGKYIFRIEGSEVYEVEVQIDGNGRIVRSACDCPYDLGPVCKHEAAAYLRAAGHCSRQERPESRAAASD